MEKGRSREKQSEADDLERNFALPFLFPSVHSLMDLCSFCHPGDANFGRRGKSGELSRPVENIALPAVLYYKGRRAVAGGIDAGDQERSAGDAMGGGAAGL